MLYRDRYRIPSARMRGWNYTSDAVYFLTICTKGRGAWFGDVTEENMDHTLLGLVAEKYWLGIPNHFPCVRCDAHVVMPDHVHGILIFGSAERCHDFDNRLSVETRHGASLLNKTASLQKTFQTNRFGPLPPNSLQLVINMYKGTVTRWCRKNDFDDFRWQPRFYERRIRSFSELKNIRLYIKDNPSQHISCFINFSTSSILVHLFREYPVVG